jgi:threonine dehydratase
MKAAACWLWDELGIAAEMAAAAGIAALQRGLIKDLQGASIGVLVCGAGIDGLSPAGQD